MARIARIHRPPRVRDGEMQRWMDTVTERLNEIPNLSVVSYSDNTGPNSRLSSYPGHIAVESASTVSHRAWIKLSGTSSSNWTPFAWGVNNSSSVVTPVYWRCNTVYNDTTFSVLNQTITNAGDSDVLVSPWGVSTSSSSVSVTQGGKYRVGIFVQGTLHSTSTMTGQLLIFLDGSSNFYSVGDVWGVEMEFKHSYPGDIFSGYAESIVSVAAANHLIAQVNYAAESGSTNRFDYMMVQISGHRLGD